MLSPSQERLLHRLCRIYSVMLLVYPSTFQREYSREMVVVFRTHARDVVRNQGGWGLPPFVLRVTWDWLHTTLQERTDGLELYMFDERGRKFALPDNANLNPLDVTLPPGETNLFVSVRRRRVCGACEAGAVEDARPR